MVRNMKLSISSDIELDGDKGGYVTWLDVRVGDGAKSFGTARIALVHVGEIADAAGEIWPALQGTKLEPLHDTYFSQGWYNDDYADGAGIDLLFIEHITIDAEHQGKNLDLALVRRLCDTIGSGCQLAVVGYTDPLKAARWGKLGFQVSTPGKSVGTMHMKLGYRHANVVDATGSGHFEVIGNGDSYAPPATSMAN